MAFTLVPGCCFWISLLISSTHQMLHATMNRQHHTKEAELSPAWSHSHIPLSCISQLPPFSIVRLSLMAASRGGL